MFYISNYLCIPYRATLLDRIYRRMREEITRKIFAFVGNDVVIRPKLKISYLNKVSIGSRSSIGDRSMIVASGGLLIGDDVMMGPEVMIFTQNHEIPPLGKKIIDGEIVTKKVVIEDDVWIGARVIILPGAVIGKGTVIAAGTVVPGKVYPDNVVLGGNPAKIIKYRNSLNTNE